MEQGNNGKQGDWAKKCAKAMPIEIKLKVQCLELFKAGNGYHRAAKELGLGHYTVRDWCRRFKTGDESWATRIAENLVMDWKRKMWYNIQQHQ